MPASFDLVAFDPGNDAHVNFVYDTFRRSMDHWPWVEVPKRVLMNRLKRELAKPGTATWLGTVRGQPLQFIGWWSVRRPDTVVFGFTKYAFRTKPEMDPKLKPRIGESALRELGVDIRRCERIWLTFWTAQAARLAARGFPLFFDTREAYDG